MVQLGVIIGDTQGASCLKTGKEARTRTRSGMRHTEMDLKGQELERHRRGLAS